MHVDGDMADGLDGVGVEGDAVAGGDGGQLGDGLMVPTSLFANMMVRSTVSSPMAASRSAGRTSPSS